MNENETFKPTWRRFLARRTVEQNFIAGLTNKCKKEHISETLARQCQSKHLLRTSAAKYNINKNKICMKNKDIA